MKPVVEFIKNTFLGGLLVLLPLLLFWALVAQAFGIIVKIAAPIVHLLPGNALFDTPRFKELLAAAVLVGASFFLGMLLRASFVRNMLNWVESRTFGRLPVYPVLKNLVSEAVQPESPGGFSRQCCCCRKACNGRPM